ncbi:MAG: hypothetical protein ACW96N_04360 [Candidatus Thorarchaeota archaeon]|jgi:hypothetical protein
MALQTRITCVPGLVTRGFVSGTHVTRGYGLCKQKRVPIIIEEIQRRARRGREAYGRTLEKVIVTAKLLLYNKSEPDPQIIGSDSVSFYEEDPRVRTRAVAKLMGTEVKKASNKIVIRVAELLDPKDGQDGND